MGDSGKRSSAFKFLLFTAIGIFYYMVPFKINGELTMMIALLKDLVITYAGVALTALVVYLMVAIVLVSAYYSLFKRNSLKSEYLKSLFVVKPITVLFRSLGAIVSVMVFHRFGPEELWSEYTGGLVVLNLMPALLCLFFFALAFLPLLLDFGGIEVLGRILQPVFKPLFRIRGSSAVLSLISYMGSGTAGMIMTDKIYRQKGLTGREAATIVLFFAPISFPAAFIYSTGIAGLKVDYFLYFVLASVSCMVISAIIMVRIPTISKKENLLIDGTDSGIFDVKKTFSETFDIALDKAARGPGFIAMIKGGAKTVFTLCVEVFPYIIFLATAVLVLTEYTSVFDIVSKPFSPLLSLMGLPEATAAAPAFITGAADLLLPYIGAATIESQLTKFVICVVGLNQIFCLSEQVVILLKSEMKINVLDLVVNFILKTIICIPIAFYLGRLFGLN